MSRPSAYRAINHTGPWTFGGLAIAADLMRGHGGTLDLVRTGGDGTEFCLNLPRHPHAIHG